MNNDTLMVVLQVAALVFAVCVHESAHGAVALWCGDPTARDLGRITLNPLRHVDPFGTILLPAMLALSGAPVFGWAKPVPVVLERARDPRRARLLVSAAGPLSNLILAGLFAALASSLRALETAGPIAQCLFWFALFSVLVNVALAVFNLLPVPPLDGFGVLEGLLPPSLDGLVATIRRLGMPILLALIFTGALRNILASGSPLTRVATPLARIPGQIPRGGRVLQSSRRTLRGSSDAGSDSQPRGASHCCTACCSARHRGLTPGPMARGWAVVRRDARRASYRRCIAPRDRRRRRARSMLATRFGASGGGLRRSRRCGCDS